MKKVIALCFAMMMTVAVLAGCNSADVSSMDTVFTGEPTPMNETSAVAVVELA